MSQVVSVKVPSNFHEACALFRKETKLPDSSDETHADCGDYIVNFDPAKNTICCEGRISDVAYKALDEVKSRFDGTLFHEGENVEELEGSNESEASAWEKFCIILAIVFFPITLIVLLIWAIFRLWRITRTSD